MRRGIGSRLCGLTPCDRLLLLVIGAWCVAGVLDNYFRLRNVTYQQLVPRLFIATVVWAAAAAVVTHSVIWRWRSLAEYGISFQRGGLGSLVACRIDFVSMT